MKKSSAIIIGILILIAAVGLLFYAFNPALAIFTVPVWKWFLAAALIYWIVKKVCFSTNLANRFSIFIPLALGFILFEKEFGALLGKGDDFVNNWLIILAAAMLDAAIWIIFSTRHKKFFRSTYGSRNSTITHDRSGKGSKEPITFKLGDHVYYVDASTQTDVNLINQLGELKVFYQNTDTGDTTTPLYLNLINQMGETTVHVPSAWHVDLTADNSMGSVNCRPDPDITTRDLIVNVKNQMGELNIVSDD